MSSREAPALAKTEEKTIDKETLRPEEESHQDGEKEESEREFCLFMKGGGCRDAFTDWEKCIEEAKNKDDIVESCFQAASALTKCMEANSDYYEPVLHAEKDSEEKTIEKDEKENHGEEEEEGECGFCLFMKGGGCRDTFTDWEKCIDEAEKNAEDIVDKCFQVTDALKKCMEAHSDYYEPILRAEKAAEEEAVRELEKEVESKEHGESK